jgi:hypothetical protein
VTVHQDVAIHGTTLEAAKQVDFALARGRFAWVQIARGEATVNGEHLDEGDGAAITEVETVTMQAGPAGCELLLFDLA